MKKDVFREHDASKSMFSIEAFYRLLLPYVLPENVQRVLWLDADMVICKEIDEFYDSTFGEDGKAMLVACWKEQDIEKLPQHKKRLQLKTDFYFNSGVILFNLPQIRQKISQKDILEYWLKNQAVLIYPDQDILNCLMGNSTILKSSLEYNNQSHCDKDAEKQLSKAKIIHYTSFMKPWHLYYEGKGGKYFWKYARMCGYAKEYILFWVFNKPVLLVYFIYKQLRYGTKK